MVQILRKGFTLIRVRLAYAQKAAAARCFPPHR